MPGYLCGSSKVCTRAFLSEGFGLVNGMTWTEARLFNALRPLPGSGAPVKVLTDSNAAVGAGSIEAESRTEVRLGAQVSGRETAIVAKGTF